MICSYQHEGSDDSSSLELRSDLSARIQNKHVILGIIQQICSIEVYRLTKMSSCYLLQKNTVIKYYVPQRMFCLLPITYVFEERIWETVPIVNAHLLFVAQSEAGEKGSPTGMRKIPKIKNFDMFAIYCIWCIFESSSLGCLINQTSLFWVIHPA